MVLTRVLPVERSSRPPHCCCEQPQRERPWVCLRWLPTVVAYAEVSDYPSSRQTSPTNLLRRPAPGSVWCAYGLPSLATVAERRYVVNGVYPTTFDPSSRFASRPHAFSGAGTPLPSAGTAIPRGSSCSADLRCAWSAAGLPAARPHATARNRSQRRLPRARTRSTAA